LEACIKEKIDRDEVKQIQSYIDGRFKTFKPKVLEKQRAEDGAAGTKKQLIKNCNCISCDRPVELPLSGEGRSLSKITYYMKDTRAIKK